MSLLRRDSYMQRGPGDMRITRRGGLLIFILVFASLVMLVLSRLNHDLVREARSQAAEYVSPVFDVASVPVLKLRRFALRMREALTAQEQLAQLKQENQMLRQKDWKAQELQQTVEKYRNLVKAVKEPGLKFATGRVIVDARGPFVRSALINIGTLSQVRNGYAVINGEGLVGRTVDTSERASRVLLLTDLNSRIPVVFGKDRARAVLIGDNSVQPKLSFAADKSAYTVGDEVVTSGDGGLFPKGLRIGRVSSVGRQIAVTPYADLGQLDFVSALFFESPGLEIANSPSVRRSQRQIGKVNSRRKKVERRGFDALPTRRLQAEAK